MTAASDFLAARAALVAADAAARHAMDTARVAAIQLGLVREARDLMLPALRMLAAANHMCSVILTLVATRVTGDAQGDAL